MSSTKEREKFVHMYLSEAQFMVRLLAAKPLLQGIRGSLVLEDDFSSAAL